MRLLPNIQMDDVLNFIEEEVVQAKSNPDVREKDLFIGYALAIASVLRSGRFKDTFTKGEPKTCEKAVKQLTKMVEGLLNNRKGKKSYILEISVESALLILEQVPKQYWKGPFLDSFKGILELRIEDMEPAFLSIIFLIYKRYKYHISKVNDEWAQGSLLSPENLNLVSPLLHKAQSSSRLHSVWIHIMDYIAGIEDSKERKSHVKSFIELLESFFDISNEHKFTALAILVEFLSSVQAEDLHLVISPNVINTLAKTSKKAKSNIKAVSLGITQKLKEIALADSNKAMAILLATQSLPGEASFDGETKSDVVKSIIQAFDAESCKIYYQHVLSAFYNCNEDDEELLERRQKRFISEIKDIGKNTQSDELRLIALKFLFFFSYYTATSASKKYKDFRPIELSDKVRAHCKLKMHHLLESIRSIEQNSDSNLKTMDQLLAFNNGLSSVSNFKPIYEPSEASKSFSSRVFQLVESLKKLSPNNKQLQKTSIDVLLYTQILLLDDEEYLDTLEDLLSCVAKLFESKKATPKGKKRKQSIEQSLNPVEVLTDTFLSLLLKAVNPIKAVIESMWKSLGDQITHDAINLLLESIENSESMVGENPEEDNEEEDEQEESDEIVDEEESEDEEVSDSDEEDEGDDDEGETEHMDIEDDDSVASETFDDEQMFKLDAVIGKMFGEMAVGNRKIGRLKSYDRDLLEFKSRALSLLDIYMEKNPTNPNVIRITCFLIKLVVSLNNQSQFDKLFAQRLVTSLKRATASKTYPKDNLPVEDIYTALDHSYHGLFKEKAFPGILKSSINHICYFHKVLSSGSSDRFGLLDLELARKLFHDAVSKYGNAGKASHSGLTMKSFSEILKRDIALGFELLNGLDKVIENAKEKNRYSIFQLYHALITKNICSSHVDHFRTISPQIFEAFLLVYKEKKLSPFTRIQILEFITSCFRIMIKLFTIEESKQIWNLGEFLTTLKESNNQGKLKKHSEKLIQLIENGSVQ